MVQRWVGAQDGALRSGKVRGRRYVYMPAAGLLVVLIALVLLRLPAQDPVVATTLLGQFPDSVAVDGQTGRAFVANYLDTTVDVLDVNSGKVLLSRTVGSVRGRDRTGQRDGAPVGADAVDLAARGMAIDRAGREAIPTR